MKKIISLLLISILIFSLTACSEKENTENNNETIIVEQTETIDTNKNKKEDHIISILTEIDDKITEELKYNTTIVVSKDIIFEDAELFLEIIKNDEISNTDKYMAKLEKFADAKYDKTVTETISSNLYAIANSNTYATTELITESQNSFTITYNKRINTNYSTTERNLSEILKKIKNNFNIIIENNEEFINLHKEVFENKNISDWTINIKDEKNDLIDIKISIRKPQLGSSSINVNYIYN